MNPQITRFSDRVGFTQDMYLVIHYYIGLEQDPGTRSLPRRPNSAGSAQSFSEVPTVPAPSKPRHFTLIKLK